MANPMNDMDELVNALPGKGGAHPFPEGPAHNEGKPHDEAGETEEEEGEEKPEEEEEEGKEIKPKDLKPIFEAFDELKDLIDDLKSKLEK